jgi:hypothetical protein
MACALIVENLDSRWNITCCRGIGTKDGSTCNGTYEQKRQVLLTKRGCSGLEAGACREGSIPEACSGKPAPHAESTNRPYTSTYESTSIA